MDDNLLKQIIELAYPEGHPTRVALETLRLRVIKLEEEIEDLKYRKIDRTDLDEESD